MAEKVKLEKISSQSFEHPADKAALEALQKTVGFDRLMKAIAKFGADKIWAIINESSNLRLSGPRQPCAIRTTTPRCPGARSLKRSIDVISTCIVGMGTAWMLAATIGASTCSSPSAHRQTRELLISVASAIMPG